MKKILFILISVLFFSCKDQVELISIKKVSLVKFPNSTSWSSPWDSDGSGPDISFIMFDQNSQSLAIGNTTYDCGAGNTPNWSINKTMTPPNEYKFEFYEDDSNGTSITMITFYLSYQKGDNYPNPVRISANGYTLELDVEYQFL